MDPTLASLIAPYALAVVAPVTGYLTLKVLDTDKRVAAHEASDQAMFSSISTTLTDLKNGQTNQTDKLDRLVEHQQDVRIAAMHALEIVEAAKASALAVVEAAALTARNRIARDVLREPDTPA